MKKEVDAKLIEALEQERNEALARVVKRVKEAKDSQRGEATHSSHSSGQWQNASITNHCLEFVIPNFVSRRGVSS